MKYVIVIAFLLVLIDIVFRFNLIGKEGMRKNLERMETCKFAKKLTPSKDTKAYKKEKFLLERARVSISVESFQVIKVLASVMAIVLSLVIIYSYQGIKTAEILNRESTAVNIVGGQRNVKDQDAFLNLLTREADQQLSYKEQIKGGEHKKLQQEVYDLVQAKGMAREESLMYAEKVYYNLLALYDNRIKPLHIVIILWIGLMFLLLPKAVVKMKASRMESLMEEELNKLEIFTLLLLKRDDINMYQILVKLKAKSDAFRPYLTRCINNYQRDGKKAMEEMQKEVNFKPFTDFVNILKQGIETNKRTTANVLEISRRLRNHIRKAQIRDKNKKKHRNIIVTRFPMIIMALYLLILPWLIILQENI